MLVACDGLSVAEMGMFCVVVVVTGDCNGVGAESGSLEACDTVGCIGAHAAALEEVEGVGKDDGVTSVTLSGRGEEGWLWS